MNAADRRGDAPVSTHWVGRLSGVGARLRPPQRFVLAGIDWQRPEDALIELCAHRASGGWTPWVRASVLGHDSDRGETVAHALVGEPVWTGPADAVQLRSGSGPVEGVNLHLVLAAAVADAGAERAAAGSGPSAEGAVAAQDPGPSTTAQFLPLATPHLPAGPGQPPIIARHAWAGGLLPEVAPGYGEVRMAFVHHSVNANGYSRAEVPALLRSIYYFHTYIRGWNDFGYNFAVDAYGRIWEGRAGGIDRPIIGAQAGGYNAESFGAVLLGDFSATLPAGAARAALARLIAWKLALHGVPVNGRVTVEVDPPDAHYTRFRPGQRVSLPRIAGHRDGCTTECPGEDMYVNGLPPLRRSVARIIGRQYVLTLDVGRVPGAYSLAPYPIAPGTKVERATYLDLATVIMTAGRELPLHGFLRSISGASVSAARISLQDLSSNRHEDPETRLASEVTDSDGLWAMMLNPHSNLLLRALHADPPAAASALVALGVRPEITLAITPRGDGVQASGTVTPAKRHVVLEALRASATRRIVAHRTIAAEGGAFDAGLRLAPGRYWVTARTPADAANIAGSSPRVVAHI